MYISKDHLSGLPVGLYFSRDRSLYNGKIFLPIAFLKRTRCITRTNGTYLTLQIVMDTDVDIENGRKC